MYFLYLLLLCHTSSLLTPVDAYVVLTANLNDFRNLAKKYVPKNLVGQIKAMIVENGHKYYKESLNDDEHIDRTDEYFDDSQQDDSYEVTQEFKTKKKPIYQLKSPSKISLAEPSSKIVSSITPTVLTIDDIVVKVKQKLFQEILDKSVNGKANLLSPLTGGSLAYRNFPKKSIKMIETKPQVEDLVNKPVPMKVIKEEVQFEATYEDALDKDITPGLVLQNPVQYLYSKPGTDNSYTKNVSPKNNRFVNTQYGGGVKKVRFVKQVLVPVNSNQGQSAYVPQLNMALQPMQKVSLDQQPSMVQHSNLEPQLSLSLEQKPIYSQLHDQANIHQSTIMKQLALMQKQIEQLNKTAQQKEFKKKQLNQPTLSTVVEIPKLNIEAAETSFEIVSDATANDQKTNDGKEDQVKPLKEETEESVVSEETTITPITETSTVALTTPGIVENEQFTEDNEVVQDSAGTSENNDETADEKITEEIKETVSKEEEGIKPDPGTGKDTKLVANTKIHTQEFGNPDVGEPIVAKTYNFDAPNDEANKYTMNLKLTVDSARKVMLF